MIKRFDSFFSKKDDGLVKELISKIETGNYEKNSLHGPFHARMSDFAYSCNIDNIRLSVYYTPYDFQEDKYEVNYLKDLECSRSSVKKLYKVLKDLKK